MTCESTIDMRHLIFSFWNVTTWGQMLSVFCLIFKYFNISSNTFLVAKTNQNDKKNAPPSLVCHGLPENAFQVNQLYNVTWSIDGLFNDLAYYVWKKKFIFFFSNFWKHVKLENNHTNSKYSTVFRF